MTELEELKSVELINDDELLITYPVNHARESLVLMRRLVYLKMHKCDAPFYDKYALSDVDQLSKVIYGLLDAHDIDIEDFVETTRPYLKVVDKSMDADDE